MITSPGVRRAVKWFAHWLVLNAPSIQYEDAVQELWVEVLKAYPKYDNKTNSFLTFIGRHLKWRSINMLSAELTRLKYDTAYAIERPNSYCIDEHPINQLMDTVYKKLRPIDQKVLETLVNPPAELLRDHCPTSREHVASWRLAAYLEVPQKDIEWSKKKIRKAIKQACL